MTKVMAKVLMFAVIACSSAAIASTGVSGNNDNTGSSRPIVSVEKMDKSLKDVDDDCGSNRPLQDMDDDCGSFKPLN
jgi:hypothetical protein